MPYNPIIDLDQLRGKTIESASLEEYNEVLILKFTDGSAFAIAAVIDDASFTTDSPLPYLKIERAVQSLHTLMKLGLIDQAEFDKAVIENKMRFEIKPSIAFPVHWKEPNKDEINEFLEKNQGQGYTIDSARKQLRRKNYRRKIPEGYRNWNHYWKDYFDPKHQGV